MIDCLRCRICRLSTVHVVQLIQESTWGLAIKDEGALQQLYILRVSSCAVMNR